MEMVANILNSYLRGDHKAGINNIIAGYMLNNFERIPHLRLTEVAENCNVSTPSVIRFCRELGFEDYSNFKEHVRRELHTRYNVEMPHSSIRFDEDESVFNSSVHDWSQQVGSLMESTILKVDKDKVHNLSEDVWKYKYVYFYGASFTNVFLEYLRIIFLVKNRIILTNHTPQFEIPLNDSPEDTLVVLVSRHGRYLQAEEKILPYLKKNSGKMWLITQNEQLKNREGMDEVLIVPSGPDETLELYQMLAVADLLFSVGQ